MIYVVDIMRDIVAAVSNKLTAQLQTVHPTITGVHYLTGHYLEIKERLANKSQTPSMKFDRYPLVCLFQDFEEDCNSDSGFEETTITMMVLYHTKKEAYNEDRYTQVIKPILAPIYDELLQQISYNRNFIVKGRIKHKRIIRPHWGNPKAYGNDGYILNDVLDGIELRNVKLTIDPNKCSVLSLK